MCMCTQGYMGVYFHICVHMQLNIRIFMCMYASVYVKIYVYDVCIYMCIHRAVYVCACVSIFIHTNTPLHIYTFTPTSPPPSSRCLQAEAWPLGLGWAPAEARTRSPCRAKTGHFGKICAMKSSVPFRDISGLALTRFPHGEAAPSAPL